MVDRLGWTLLHFVWEGAAVALLLALALLLTRRASARYALALAALVVMAALPVATFLALAPSASAFAASGSLRLSPGETVVGSAQADARMPLLVGVWAAGVLFLSLRLVGTLLHLARWKRRHARPASPEDQARLDALAHRLNLRRPVLLYLSDRLEVPSAWGVLRPVVLLPASLLTGLPPAQVEGILLHELAHVRRHDYLVNLVQSVVETALFYHPAVWWVSSIVRREREHLCDDLVVSTLGDPMPYARALLHLEERRQAPRPVLSAKEGNLMNRIARILARKPAPSRLSPLAPALAALAIVGLALGGVLQAEAQAAPKKTPKKPAAPVRVEVKGGAQPVTPNRPSGRQTRYLILDAKALQAERLRLMAERRALRVELMRAQREIAVLKARSAAQSSLPTADKSLAEARAKADAQMAKELAARQQELAQLRALIAQAQAQATAAQAQASAAETLKAERAREAQAFADASKTAPERRQMISEAERAVAKAQSGLMRSNAAVDEATKRAFALPRAGTFDAKAFSGPGGFGALKGTPGGFDGTGFEWKKLPGSELPKALSTTRLDAAKSLFSRSAWAFGSHTSLHVTVGKNGLASVNGEHVPFTDVVRGLASQAGIGLVILPGDYQDVNVVLKDVPWQKALKILCAAAGAKWKQTDGYNLISPAKR